MIVNEETAGEKFCPMDFGQRCLGSDCMAWQWFDAEPEVRVAIHHCENPEALEEPERPIFVPANWIFSPYDPGGGEPAWWEETAEEYNRRVEYAKGGRRGFCGLTRKAF